MSGPLALLNGRMIPAAELVIPAYDAGFVLGATVSEQLRTFGGKLYKLDEHLARLHRGLKITTIDAGCTTAQLAAWAEELVSANSKLLDPGDDLGLSIFVTPGPYATFAPSEAARRATIGMSTYPLPFQLWAEKYKTGEHLVVSRLRQVSSISWPRELKHRSRMHYYLAERDVHRRHPEARPLLLDEFDSVNETPTANVVSCRDGEFATPPRSEILPGISLQAMTELSSRVGVKIVERALGLGELQTADEVILTSTPFCLLPATKVNEAPIGDGRPGPMFKKLLDAWSAEVGVDIAEQARRFALRKT